jgi:hypothetical protein
MDLQKYADYRAEMKSRAERKIELWYDLSRRDIVKV